MDAVGSSEGDTMVRETEILKDAERLVQYAHERFEVSLSISDAEIIAKKFAEMKGGWASRNSSSSGHVVWIAKRLQEAGYFRVQHNDPSDIRLFALLHFWPWEGKPWGRDSVDDMIEWPATVRRSPLSRMGDFEPINRVARRIAGDGGKPCPYCRRYYRNPAALSLHLAESHEQEILRR
jgi:hypothetical protein